MRALPLLLMLAGCAADAVPGTRQADALAADLAGFTPGAAQTCLSQIERRGAQVRGYGDTLVYSVSPTRKYVSRAPGCEGVARGEILVTVESIGQLCRGDIARTLDQGSRMQTGVCSLGDFTAYTR